MYATVRERLPRPTDRIQLGSAGVKVSPVCMGITGSPDTVLAAYEAGLNFFFLSADLHWPLYEHTREGLRRLLATKARRNDVVVGVVSYLDEPLFSALQFHEVLDSVPGLERVDVLIAGAVSSDASFYPRIRSLGAARAIAHCGARAIGASFHQRPYVLMADHHQLLDISFVRYNTAHPGARNDIFPYVKVPRASKMFNFKSVLSCVPPETFRALGLPRSCWQPEVTDYYRFALSRPELDGVLCSPQTPQELHGLCAALEKPPLSQEEQEYMIWLSMVAQSPVMA